MKIMAVGGGKIGQPGFPIETEKINREMIKLSGKKCPKLLFIPTASSDSEGYVDVIKKYFGKRLGCRVDVLYLLKGVLSKQEIRKKILNTDIIYVGGGNTLKMMNTWRKLGVDKLLREAGKRNIVLSGVSAGAICWFNYGNSDSRKFKNSKAPMIRVRGLGLIPALCCPHYDVERQRKPSLRNMMKNTSGVAIALDNCAAIEIVDEKYRIITSKPKARVYRVYWSRGKFFHQKIKSSSKYELLSELLVK